MRHGSGSSLKVGDKLIDGEGGVRVRNRKGITSYCF